VEHSAAIEGTAISFATIPFVLVAFYSSSSSSSSSEILDGSPQLADFEDEDENDLKACGVEGSGYTEANLCRSAD
jgi:hypothetical protein